MNKEDIKSRFSEIRKEDSSLSEALVSINVLIDVIKKSTAETLYELRSCLNDAIRILKDTPTMVTSINSGCELFIRFITLTDTLGHADFATTKKVLVERGETFLKKAKNSRKKIAHIAEPFIMDGSTILIHGKSRVVLEILKLASTVSRKHFKIYITESQPDCAGREMYKVLKEMNIQVIIILDSAVGYIMEQVDFVLIGAEGVVESGGIINKIGTFNIGIVAKEMNKPFYVVAESYKFARLFPLNQQDLPNEFKFQQQDKINDEESHPRVDYTPPNYISLLFTDLGILTPSAVSDELIQLYL